MAEGLEVGVGSGEEEFSGAEAEHFNSVRQGMRESLSEQRRRAY